MKKFLFLFIGLFSLNLFGQEIVGYGITYNNSTEQNEIWAIYTDGTDELVESFAFPSGFWQPTASYADEESGVLWLKDSNGSYVAYDPSTDTITLNNTIGRQSYQNIFPTSVINSTIQTTTNAAGETVTQVGTDQVTDSDGDTMISTETDADGDEEIHIGENSLITVEKDGVQQLWAENADGDAIDINIKEDTNLLIDGLNVAQEINSNKTNISTNTSNIATNTSNIATNTANIATNTANIATNTANIATNTTNIATNTAGILNNSNLISQLDNRMDTLENLVEGYTQGIASSIAMSQFDLSQDGFSVGVGMGKFQNVTETALGFGYGRELNNGRRLNVRFSKSSDSSGLGFSMSF
jgi:hypothetical protein